MVRSLFSGADVQRSVPGRFWSGFLCLVLCLLPAAASADEVFSRLSVLGSSEPVAVYDMVNGWDTDFRRGSLAYADARVQSGFRLSGWTLAYERRGYYYLGFSRDTSEFYNNLEQGIDTGRRYELDLKVQTLSLRGVRLSYALNYRSVTVEPVLTYYRVGDYQIGSLNGFSEGSGDLEVSALLDYYFNEDKLLEYPANAGEGRGISAGLTLSYQYDDWLMSASLQDLLNRFELPNAAFTRGCINLAGSAQAVCSGNGAASGVSGDADYRTDIPLTFEAQAQYTPWNLQLDYYRHENYQRLSARKSWPTMIGTLGVSAHSTRQLGLHWNSRWHELSVAADDADWQAARELQLQLGLRFPW